MIKDCTDSIQNENSLLLNDMKMFSSNTKYSYTHAVTNAKKHKGFAIKQHFANNFQGVFPNFQFHFPRRFSAAPFWTKCAWSVTFTEQQ